MRTKLDGRIRTQIENGVASGHRSMFALVGDKSRDQVPILYHILSKSTVSARPSVLWCYKKELSFSTHRKKKAKKIKKAATTISGSLADADPFDVFISSTQIRYCYYNETEKILGNTFGVLVLQDFEAMTPNLLARTIETIEGGGMVILLMQSVKSLRQLYTISMDVHNRYRTEAHNEITARFNERFILSLASSPSILVLDDQLRVLPISSHIENVEAIPAAQKKAQSESDAELASLKEAMKETKPIGPLLSRARTACQAKALLRFLDVITEKQSTVTCSLTAGRGRGKSAAVGLSLAGAIAFGYTNIFVTSPSPENLKTLFEFVVKGFDALDYQEHTDYELIQSTNPDFKNCLVRINVFREHKQTIQYISPTDVQKLGQCELVVIDEAAAIPLPLVKELISGPYISFLSSTINGYEGTGRSLSLKLLQQLRQQSAGGEAKDGKSATSKGRTLHEMHMDESIRYKPGDKIEKWLNRLLCLDATNCQPKMECGTPPPAACELYVVNRDTLFSFHDASEAFLQQIMAIFVSAHYKNSPNDLQMLSDAPAHNLFVLMAPVDKNRKTLPEVLAVVQICLEGRLDSDKMEDTLERGKRAAGDLLPWTISQQFMDKEFGSLCGARIVRVAVHPDYQSMGYGSRAVELIEQYYLGEATSLDEEEKNIGKKTVIKQVKDGHTVELLEERIEPRADLPPLLQRLDERKPEKLDYLGVSFGLTVPLLKFWKRSEFVPVYIRQNSNDITGEHTCIMLKGLEHSGDDEPSATWLPVYWREFRRRLVNLLSFDFSTFPAQMALSLLQLKNKSVEKQLTRHIIERAELALFLSNTDLRRMSQYGRNMVDSHVITDLLPVVGKLYFEQRMPQELKLAVTQSAILLARGLQHKQFEDVSKELDLPMNQIFALLTKAVRRIVDWFDEICETAVRSNLDAEDSATVSAKPNLLSSAVPLANLEQELDEAAKEIRARHEKDRKQLLAELGNQLQKYEITQDESELAEAYKQVGMKYANKLVSVKSKRTAIQAEIPDAKDPLEKKAKKKKQSFGKGRR
uniref:RNA cytidine acetyltransferase n=1 Tax=Caenorhabditis japonica TaxID=281687 RepID=A0A8R1I198_CAEJA